MISVRFEADGLTGIRMALRAFLADTRDEAPTPQVGPIEPAPAQTEAARAGDVPTVDLDIPHSAVERAKRTRRTKAEMEAARAAEAATPVTEAAAATAEATPAPAAEKPAPATFSDAKAALTRVVQTEGLGVPAGTEMLKAAGVARLSQLTEEQWAGFVAVCEAKLKAHAA